MPMVVVAAALFDESGRVLMQRRPLDKHHGGLWEFPGGKVEPGETPVVALVREIDEELGIDLDPADIRPLTFATRDHARDGPAMVLLLYTCSRWSGEPCCEPGARLEWVGRAGLAQLEKPPLDVILAEVVFSSLK
jgi:8-oxo-dGTP diphosphatase